MMRSLLALVLPCLLLVPGCKESEDPLTQCVNLSACGGELEGTWNVSTICYPDGEPELEANEDCPEQVVELRETEASGSITFLADGTYTSDMSTTLRYDIHTPLSCIGGTNAGCDVAEAALLALGFAGGCAVESDACICNLSLTAGGQDNGTYQTSGNAVTLTDGSGDVSTGEYCVDGSRLGYLTTDTDDAGNEFQTNILLTK